MTRTREEEDRDRSLHARCLARADGAWEELVRAHAGLVYGVIHGVLGRSGRPSRTDAVEELFDSVFEALLDRDQRRLQQWSGRCSLASWVRLVAASVVVDRLRREGLERRHRRDLDPASLVEIGEDAPTALDLLLRDRQREELREAFETLAASDRRLLECLVIEESPSEAVAAELGIRAGALYTRKTRALQRLRTALIRVRSRSEGAV